MTGDTTFLGMALLVLVPLLGKVIQWLVNFYKTSRVISGSSATVKQFLGWLTGAILGWAATALAIHFTGTTVGTLTTGDVGMLSSTIVVKAVIPALVGLLSWFNAMFFHNASGH